MRMKETHVCVASGSQVNCRWCKGWQSKVDVAKWESLEISRLGRLTREVQSTYQERGRDKSTRAHPRQVVAPGQDTKQRCSA